MGVVMGTTAVILGFAAALAALVVWTALIFPRPAARARLTLEARPVRCFVLGVVLVILLGIPALALLRTHNGLAKLAGWALAFPLAAVLVVGLAAMAALLGERLQPLSPAMTPLGGLVRGVITLELSMALPFLGWFLFAPAVSLTLIGAGALGSLPRRRREISPDWFAPPTAAPHSPAPEEPSAISLTPVSGIRSSSEPA